MGELIDSDPELNQADIEQDSPLLRNGKPGMRMSAMNHEQMLEDALDDLYDDDSDHSFMSATSKKRASRLARLRKSS
jgi:hypothetical protein